VHPYSEKVVGRIKHHADAKLIAIFGGTHREGLLLQLLRGQEADGRGTV